MSSFSGQAYAFQRRARSSAEIVIVPDRGLFNFFKPAPGAVRVKFDSDPEFEGKFEVYATEPSAAQLLIGSDVRRTLLELRQAGKVFAYVGGDDAFVAVTGKNRFEPGGMFRSTPSDQRIKTMFDDVCAQRDPARTAEGGARLGSGPVEVPEKSGSSPSSSCSPPRNRRRLLPSAGQ